MKHFMGTAAKCERGFTLVELVVVIAILGVLAAISVPLVNNFLDSSKAQAYNLERERIQRAVDAYRSHPLNARFTGRRQYPIHGEAKTRGTFEQPDGDTTTRTVVITGNPLGGSKGGQPLWVDENADGIRGGSVAEEDLNDEDDVTKAGWQVATVARQGVDYIVDSRDYFINFERLILQGLLEAVPPTASPDNQPQGSMRTFVGPYSWYINSQGIVDSLLFAYPVPANAGYQDVFPSQKQPEGTTPPSIEGNQTVDENSLYTLTLISRDPRVIPDKWEIDWGDGDSDEVGTGITTATHTYLDGTKFYTISAIATDSAGVFTANTIEVQVINLPPIIKASGGVTRIPSGVIKEGEFAKITVDAEDPGPNDLLKYEFDCNGDSRFEQSGGNNFANCFFDKSGDIQVNVRVTDGDGGSDTSFLIVMVTNVPPVIAFTAQPDSVSEGTIVNYAFSISDPGDSSFTFVATLPGCGEFGVLVNNSQITDATGGSFDCSFPDSQGTDTIVQVQIKDDNDTSNELTVDVTIVNEAPEVIFTIESDNALEGETRTYSFSVTDPGVSDTFTVPVGFPDCGSGTLEDTRFDNVSANPGDGSFDCSFDDDTTSPTAVRMQVEDSDNLLSNAASVSVTVGNLPPEIRGVSQDGPIDEGESVTITVDADDPGTDTLTYHFDCDNSGDFELSQEDVNSTTCSFDDSGIFIVKVKVTDGQGGEDTGEISVTVDNVAPEVIFTAPPVTAEEGDTKTYSFNVTDDGVSDTFTNPVPDCGSGDVVGTQFENLGFNPGGGSFDCFFPDGPVSTTVSMQLEDTEEALSNFATVTPVVVSNLNPTIDSAVTNSEPAVAGFTTTITVDASDLGINDILRYEFDCDNSGGANPYEISPQLEPSHKCSLPVGDTGPLTVNVRVTDEDGGFVLGSVNFNVVEPPAFKDVFALEPEQRRQPGGLAWDPSTGQLWMVDEKSHRVFRYSPVTGDLLQVIDVDKSSQKAKGITVDDKGFWVLDASKNDEQVLRYDRDGVEQTTGLLKTFGLPDIHNKHLEGITSDGNSLWILDIEAGDSGSGRVLEYDLQGVYQDRFIQLVEENDHAEGITIFGNSLWVVNEGKGDDDPADNVVGKVFKYSTITLLLQPGYPIEDSPATHPEGIATDGINIWVVDKDKHLLTGETTKKEHIHRFIPPEILAGL